MLPFISDASDAVPVTPVAASDLSACLDGLDPRARRWADAIGFKAEPGQTALLPDAQGGLARVLVGWKPAEPLWALAALPDALPERNYMLDAAPAEAATALALGWALGAYQFTRYKERKQGWARMVWPVTVERGLVERLAEGVFLARDLINTPTEDMGPADLAAAAEHVASRHGATFRTVVGDALLEQNYPTIHLVGRAAAPGREPRLIDLAWGDAGAPKVTLVGKGVCFDTGGLDLKPSSGMRLMKKDMGGAATMLGLAHAVMAADLKVRLRVLIPAVENSVAGNAMRPLDIVRTRKGLTVEIGNTDAEGRLILCDALTEADSEKPALLLDFATLTGAARVALGPDLPALFANDDALAEDLLRAGMAQADPLWRLPLWAGYRGMYKSPIADLNNISESPFAGAIVAALYLQEFVSPETKWAHVDTYAWNAKSRPGRPEGGEGLGLRAAYAMIAERFDG
ncbi:MAG TPA: leucyl aminopeptidase family protein [Stellaceae bacterium]|nr:leucyl aminopeptidase family protein [Stellaceae bacterium]